MDFDAFDFFVLTFLLTDVAKAFGESRPTVAFTLTLTLAMRPIGALIFGVMADRFGRRIPMTINIVFYAVMSALSGLAPSFGWFLVLRPLFGIGMGGQWGIGASLVLESVPAKWRGVLSGLLHQGYSLGNLLAAPCLSRGLSGHAALRPRECLALHVLHRRASGPAVDLGHREGERAGGVAALPLHWYSF